MVNANVNSWRVAAALLCAAVAVSSLWSAPSLGQRRSPDRGADLRTVSRLPSKENRWALIIGVSAYEEGNITPLPGANNDARALRDALRDYAGFEEKNIILLTTDEAKDRRPTKNNILRLLGNLSGTVPKDGLLLVAFSGHGIERQNRAFLLASDTPYNDNIRVLERTAISVQDDIKELIRDTGVKQVIILLDACRNDPTSGRSDSDNPLTPAFTKGFSFDVRNSEIEAFATLYATSIGARAYEYAREGKGYFTWAFIEGLKGGAANEQGEVTLGGLVRYVEKYVPRQVKIDLGGGKNQRPFSIIEGYQAEGLVLAVAGNTNSNLKPTLPPATGTGEQIYWREIEKRNTITAYENYLSRYPNGEFVNAAKLRLGALKWANFKPVAQRMLKYHDIRRVSEGLAAVRETKYPGKQVYSKSDGEKSGFIDKTGEEIVPLRYDAVDDFKEGLAKVCLRGKCGFIDKTGKEVIPLQLEYDDIGDFSEGLALVRVGDWETGKTGYIDKSGKEVIPPRFADAQSFSQGMACVQVGDSKDGKWGFIDSQGRVVITPRFDEADSFSEELAFVRLNDKWGFIDKDGNEALPFKYTGGAVLRGFREGLAAVRLNGKYGYIDKAGKEVIPFKYDYAYGFREGIAAISLGHKLGYIDKTGREIVPPKYTGDVAASFRDGLALVGQGEGDDMVIGLVDNNGREVIPVKYTTYVLSPKIWCWAFLSDGFVGVYLDGRRGFVDIYGNEYFDL